MLRARHWINAGPTQPGGLGLPDPPSGRAGCLVPSDIPLGWGFTGRGIASCWYRTETKRTAEEVRSEGRMNGPIRPVTATAVTATSIAASFADLPDMRPLRGATPTSPRVSIIDPDATAPFLVGGCSSHCSTVRRSPYSSGPCPGSERCRSTGRNGRRSKGAGGGASRSTVAGGHVLGKGVRSMPKKDDRGKDTKKKDKDKEKDK